MMSSLKDKRLNKKCVGKDFKIYALRHDILSRILCRGPVWIQVLQVNMVKTETRFAEVNIVIEQSRDFYNQPLFICFYMMRDSLTRIGIILH